MIDFISIENENSENSSYYKGKLFEDFICKLLIGLGYTDINGRSKKNSLEYDFDAKHSLKKIPLIGEAKAWDKKIDGQTITAFTGKMLPHWMENDKSLGLFVTTSELTADAEDYISKIKNNYNFETISAKTIFEYLKKHMGFYKLDEISKYVSTKSNLLPKECRLIITDNGEFYIQFLSTSDKVLASHYCIIDKDLNFKNDDKLNKILAKKWTELGELEFIPNFDEANIELNNYEDSAYLIKKSEILYSEHCFDYKLPVSPKFFIGREELLETFDLFVKKRITNQNSQLIYQIISKSGVGKSSALIKIADSYKKNNIVITKDVREIKSKLDFDYFLRQIVFQVSDCLNIEHNKYNFDRKFLEKLNETLLTENKSLFIFIDQFESLFFQEDIYDLFLDLFKDCFQLTKNIIFVIARKNDQPTTFDEKATIDLKTLESLSQIYLLKDFTKLESSKIFEKLQDETKKKISNSILDSILEFSRGFPWLLKRVCAHLIKQLEIGIDLSTIAKSSLNLSDLFDEELDELNEDEKDFLVRIVKFLPASISELDVMFEERSNMYKILQRLQDKRLIRLSGSRYDTYNDVFKEYIINGKISDFNISYLFRTSLNKSLEILKDIISRKKIHMPEYIKEINISDGTFFNQTKELKDLRLIDYYPETGVIEPNEDTLTAFQNKNLASFIRSQLRKNGIVSELISKINENDGLNYDDIKNYIIEAFPLIEANDKTWDFYTKYLIDWLANTLLIYEKNEKYFIPEKTSQEISLLLGNLDHLESSNGGGSRGRRKTRILEYYTPTVRINILLKTLEKCANDVLSNDMTQKEKSVLNEAILLKFIDNTKGKYLLTNTGVKFLKDEDFRANNIQNLFLSIKELRDFIVILSNSDDNILIKKAYEDYAKNSKWAKGTLDWKAKMITNWFDAAKIGKRLSVKKLVPNKTVINNMLNQRST